MLDARDGRGGFDRKKNEEERAARKNMEQIQIRFGFKLKRGSRLFFFRKGLNPKS